VLRRALTRKGSAGISSRSRRPIHVEVFGFERLLRSGGWILIHVSILA
jgi:hypothetical protein